MGWHNTQNLNSKAFSCGWCGNAVATPKGFQQQNSNSRVYICPHCDRPSSFIEGKQLPGISPGAHVGYLPVDVNALYQEARDCSAASCYSAAVLICRKLLMNIAVAQGAKPGESFISYVEYLADNGYVPPNGKVWVDHIRKKGNEATHEIVLMSQDDAQELISFAEMLLKFIFEFPSRVPAGP